MTDETHQMKTWAGGFGKEYTDRNTVGADVFEKDYKRKYGMTRVEINDKFIGQFDRNIRILEVGSNVGNQLLCLQRMGFCNLFGIELQQYAVEAAKCNTRNINIIQGSVFDILFKDNCFDLVFTSGVLIHIQPHDLPKAFKEIVRVANTYIWGFEYWAEVCQTIPYRGQENLLWKADYAAEYQKHFQNLELVQKEKYPYLIDGNVDAMFLLKKKDSL